MVGMKRLALLMAFCILAGAARKDTPVDLTLNDSQGGRVHLRDLRGKIAVVNFWATWCVPCRAEMPLLVKAEQTWRDKGVLFLAVSLDEKDTRKGILKFVDTYGVSFPVWTGANGDDLAKLGLGEAVPGTAFLDERGVIFARVLGQMREGEIDERLRWITGDRSQAPPTALMNHVGK